MKWIQIKKINLKSEVTCCKMTRNRNTVEFKMKMKQE